MKYFNFKGLFKFIGRFAKYIFKTGKFTINKILWFLIFCLGYPLWQLIVWSGMFIDRIFFFKFKQTKINQPIFIIGNPRSGTTFLHRLLNKDKDSFISMKTWEIFIAPSIFGRKYIHTLSPLDKFLGQPIHQLLKRLEKKIQSNNPIHKIAFWQPEEDDYLFLHIWSSPRIWKLVGLTAELRYYTFFDQLMSKRAKSRILDFYKRCLQRHLHFHQAQDKHYLAKNPHFSPMVSSLNNKFPDAKFIYLVRNPLNVIPSFMSMTIEEWSVTLGEYDLKKIKEHAFKMAKHWYDYPLKTLDKLPKDQYHIVKLEDLSQNVSKTIKNIYQHFGLSLSPKYKKILAKETLRAREHKSKHDYSLEEMGVTKKEIINEFQEVFYRFDFPIN
jgi:hypothetical protein